MLKPRIAAHAVELDHSAHTGGPAWVHLLPLGTFQGRDGRGPYQLRDQAHAAEVIAATRRRQGRTDIPGDYDHQLIHSASNGRPAPASGWIKDLDARPDGIWGRIEWTAEAAAAIGKKEYRYLSPVFGHRADGTVTTIRAFGLSNLPNLELTALASQSPFTSDDEDAMTEAEFKALLKKLGLSETTTTEQLAAHCEKLVGDAKSAKASRDAIAVAIGKTAGDKDEAITAAAQELVSQAKAGAPDPAKFVPMAAFAELQQQVTAMSTQLSGDKAAAVVATAKAEGKLSPALEAWAKAYAEKDLAGFVAWASQAPQIITPAAGGGAGAGAKPPVNSDTLSAEELAVCSQLGIKPDDFKKERAASQVA
jgi:phage I-like protein